MSTNITENVPGVARELGEQFKFIAEVTEVFSSEDLGESSERLNLISTTARFGIIFIACKSSIRVFRTKELIDNNATNPVKIIRSRGSITHISTSCDGLTLFVVVLLNNGPFGIFYDISHIAHTDKECVPFYSVQLNPNIGSRVVSLSWNPCDPACIALAYSTGDLSLIKIKDSSVEFINQNAVGANAIAWSAKGKQLAVGKSDSTLSLFKPDLTLVRSIEAPAVQDIGPIIDITWFTNTEFFVAYITMSNIPALMYMNAPKGKPATFINFDDVCYGTESEKPISYYTVFISEWNLLFVFSSSGVEMAVIGKTETENNAMNWCVWSPDEGAKAIMHYYNVVDETFPLGLAVDFTSQKLFPSKDETTKGPFPFFVTISTKGELNTFFVENQLNNSQTLITPTENLPLSCQRKPEQYGQPTTAFQHTFAESSFPSELKQNSLSAFSSIAKKSEVASSPVPLSFSTPIKSMFSDSSTPLPPSSSIPFSSFSSNNTFPALSSSLFSFTPTSTNTTSKPIFGNPLISKPVSLSNQIGSSTIHVPSPQKSDVSQVKLPTPPTLLPTISLPSQLVPPLPPQVVPPLPPQVVHPLPPQVVHPLPPQVVYPLPPQAVSPLSPQVVSPLPPQVATPLPQSPAPSPRISKESVLYHIQKEEQQFENELQDLRASVDVLEHQIGMQKEDLELKTSLEKIKEWVKEMKITTLDQSDEISQLHKKTLEALASYEDAIAHKDIKFSSRNQVYLQLRPLDPYSQRKLDEVRSKYQYLVSQISEVNTKLDLQWEEFASQKKPKRLTGEPKSSTENLYRSVLNLHNTRVASEKKFDDLTHHFKKLNIGPLLYSSTLNSSFDSGTENMKNFLNLSNSEENSPYLSPSKISPKMNRQLKEILAQRSLTPHRVHTIGGSPLASGTVATDEEKNYSQRRTVYEDISPAISPVKISAPSSNPLAALSSLVGKVPTSKALVSLTSNVAASSSSANTEVSAASSFPFSNNKQSTIQADIKKDFSFQTLPDGQGVNNNISVSSGSSFQINLKSASNQLAESHSPAFSSSLFSNNKFALQGFGSPVASPSAVIGGVTTPVSTVLQGGKSPLLDMLNTNKSNSETTGSAVNFAQFFKGVPPITTTSSTLGSLFSTPVNSNESTEPKNTLVTSPSLFNTSLGGSSLLSSNSALKPTSTSEVSLNVSQKRSEISSDTSPALQIPTALSKETSVLSANPILSNQILKETSAISAAGGSAVANGGILNQLSKVSSVFSQGGTSSNGSLFKKEESSLTSLSSDTSAVPNSSIFGQPAIKSSTTAQPTTSASPFGQSLFSTSIFSQPTTSSSSFGQSTTSTSVFSQPTTSSSSSSSSSSSVFSQPTTSSSSSSSSSVFSHPTTSSSSSSSSSPTSTSIFGQPPSSSSIFGQPPSSSSIFGQPPSSTTSIFGQPTTSTTSTFGQLTTSITSTFGQPTTSSSIFGQPASSSSIFSQSTTNSLFGQSPGGSSLSSSKSVTVASGFGSTTTSSTITTSITAATTTTMTTTTNAISFGQPNANSSIFSSAISKDSNGSVGSQAPTISPGLQQLTSSAPLNLTKSATSANTQATLSSPGVISVPLSTPSIFGQSTILTLLAQNGNTQSVVEQTPTAVSSSTNKTLFDQLQPSQPDEKSVTTAGSTLFSTSSSAPSPFGQAPTNTSSIFGKPLGSSSIFSPSSQPSTGSVSSSLSSFSLGQGSTGGSLFSTGGTTQNIFGGGSVGNTTTPTTTTTTTTTQSIFGAVCTNSTQSVFGNQSAVSQSTSSAFSSTPSNQSVFGGPGSGSAFQSSSFASGSVFGQGAKTDAPASITSNWGASATPGSLFGGQTSSPFGQQPKAGNSIFGNTGAQTTGSIFGGPSTTTSASVFGGNITGGSVFSSAFGQSAGQSSPFTGGSMFSGLGKPPNKEDASKNVFGSVKSEIAPSTNIFGGSSGGTSSSFGAFTSQTPAGTFSPVKSAPTFGGGPVFGASPTFADANKTKSVFGGEATFGGGATFGGTAPAMGEGSSAFGSSNSSTFGSAGFGNFATAAGGSTFGTLANTSQTGVADNSGFGQLSRQGSGSGVGNPSSFGGSSFTSWR